MEHAKDGVKNRFTLPYIIGALWVVGIAITIITYHLWWYQGRNSMRAQCNTTFLFANCENVFFFSQLFLLDKGTFILFERLFMIQKKEIKLI